MILLNDIVSMLLAVFLGSAIGLEREISGKSAGLRTNVLICLGAAVFTIISKNLGGSDDSVTRIAAQIVTGVGFLGAGAIIRDRGGVQGLTTAATIWLVASIGLACGGGYYGTALIATFIAVIVLIGLRHIAGPLENYLKKHKQEKTHGEEASQK